MKQQLIFGRLGEGPEESRNLNENYHNLLEFVMRMDKIIQNLTAEIDPALSHISWKDSDEIAHALTRFKQRDTMLLEGKLRYFRDNTYFKESTRARYIRLGISFALLLFLWSKNKPADSG